MDSLVERRIQDELSGWPTLLAPGERLAARREEGEAILKEYGTTHEEVAKRLMDIMNGPYKRSDGEQQELYTSRKHVKEWSYARQEGKRKDRCPWHGGIEEMSAYTITRTTTTEEEQDFASYMTLGMILRAYEREEGGKDVFDERLGDEKRAQYEAYKEEYEALERKPSRIHTIHYTELLPHLIKEHRFFLSGITYHVDIPFLLEALGFKRKE